MTITMAQHGEKVGVMESPAYIVTPSSTDVPYRRASKGIQQKHFLIGMVILVGLIVAGVLVGMHIFAEAQKEIVKFSLNFKSGSDGENIKQDVVSDPNDNSVLYKITKDGKDVYIVNDFNRDLQVVKMETDFGTNCYISALNRSAVMDPSQITGPEANWNGSTSSATIFAVSTSPISDRSFLPKKALDMCKSVSVYWAFRSCGNKVETSDGRQPRDVTCITGCCYEFCSCSWRFIQTSAGCFFYNYCPAGYTWRYVC